MKNATSNFLLLAGTVAALMGASLEGADGPPDLTKGLGGIDRSLTFNLGATGLRGWIFNRPEVDLDRLQGRTTARSRQILVTHIGAKSPADGVMKVDDVILGAGGKLFSDDARKSFGRAIQEAEKEENKGVLKLTVWRAGKTEELELKLRVMGTYSDTAPYDCPKSKRILEEACAALEKEPPNSSWGSIKGLALMATGNPKYLPQAQKIAHQIGPPSLKIDITKGMSSWFSGYDGIFLCEYYLLTGDKAVEHAVNELTTSLAKGQGKYGTFGHGIAPPSPEGKLHGSIPPYGPVNSAGLPANMAIVLGAKCRIRNPEIEAAVLRANGFFGYFVEKGCIPYGEHEPEEVHECNGRSSQSALLFAFQDDHVREMQFFAKMATAGWAAREVGHTGQGFGYLWTLMGANVGGPTAAAAFFKEISWHLDLVRRCDGTFTYDGGEQWGAGTTEDNTYYGRSSCYGMGSTASYILSYSLPLKKLLITGRESKEANWLTRQEVADAIAAGRFDLDRKQKKAKELYEALGSWSPRVRQWAVEELVKRPEARSMAPQLIAAAEGSDARLRLGACEMLGEMRSQQALPVFLRLLRHEDRGLRLMAARSIRNLGGGARSAIPDILKTVIETAEPLEPVNWADPIQFTHNALANALFFGGLTDGLKKSDPNLLFPALEILSRNAGGRGRVWPGSYIQNALSAEDVKRMGEVLMDMVRTPAPADTMFGNESRMAVFRVLAKYHFKEGLAAGVHFAKTQGGHGSEGRTGEIMKELVKYGTAAREIVPQLKELIVALNAQCKKGEFPAGELNDRRVNDVKEAIKAIEAATTQPDLRSLELKEPALASAVVSETTAKAIERPDAKKVDTRPAPAAPAGKQVAFSPQALEQWQARLVTKLDSLAKGGAKVKYFMADTEGYVVTGANEKSLFINVQGNIMPLPWKQVSNGARAALAKTAATDGDAEALLIAAVFQLANGNSAAADDLFARAAANNAEAARVARAELESAKSAAIVK